MPRYSVDIDLTYIPITDRRTSIDVINTHLTQLKQMIERTVPGIKVVHKPDVLKLQCSYEGAMVKIEVNGTKRGIIGATGDHMLCARAQNEFQMGCKARIVSFSQLYGGKITAALSRQHPRDLSAYPSIRWKQQNIIKLKEINPRKHLDGINKLRESFS